MYGSFPEGFTSPNSTRTHQPILLAPQRQCGLVLLLALTGADEHHGDIGPFISVSPAMLAACRWQPSPAAPTSMPSNPVGSGGTCSGSPIACGAALASMDYLTEHDLPARAPVVS